MQRMYNFVKYMALGLIAGLLIVLMNDSFVRTLLSFVLMMSIFFVILVILCPPVDFDIRIHRINQFLGKE